MIYPIPFPLSSGRYEVGPAMRRFGTAAGEGLPAEQAHFLPDDELAATLSAKLAVLRQAPDESHLIAPGAGAGLRAAIHETFRILAAEQPAMATVAADGVTLHHLGLRVTDWTAPTPGVEAVGEPWPELGAVAGEIRTWLERREGIWRLGDALGLAVQEDLAIVRGPGSEDDGCATPAGGDGVGPVPAGRGPAGAPPTCDVLEWLHVCLPSNWAPAEKIGRSFIAVHEPVVHSERLLASHARIIRAMIQSGPFARYVWALHRDAELCHNPRLHQAPPWVAGGSPADLAGQACFRVERQTTHGFPALNRALFTIRYWVEPLADTVADPWRRERVASALAGMDAAALAYKGLSTARDRLVMWLKGPA